MERETAIYLALAYLLIIASILVGYIGASSSYDKKPEGSR